MTRPDFQAYQDETGAVNIAPGSVVAFNSGGTEVFTIGNKTLDATLNTRLSIGTGKWLVLPGLTGAPSGTFEGLPAITTNGEYFNAGSYGQTWDANDDYLWQISYTGGTLTLSDLNYEFPQAISTSYTPDILSRNYGTSTLDEQEYAYDSTTGGVELWLGVTDPTLKIELDTATGIATLSDATDVIAERTGDLATLQIIGHYVPTAYGNTTYGAGLQMVIVDYDTSPASIAASVDGQDNYNGGSAFDFSVAWGGGSLFSPVIYRVDLLPDITDDPGGNNYPTNSTATIETGNMVATDDGEWRNVASRDWLLTASGLSDGTDTVAELAVDFGDGIAGIYEATAYGETTYNGGDAFRFVIGQIAANINPGWHYVTITIDGSDDATALSGPFFAGEMPANTSTEIHVPIASVDLAGNVTQWQQGTINWRP